MIWSKGLKYTGFDEGHPGVVLRKLGEDQSKTLPIRLFFTKRFLVVVTTLSLSKPPQLLQLCKHMSAKLCPKSSISFLYFVFSSVGPSIWIEIANNRFTMILRGLCCFCPYEEGCYARLLSPTLGWLLFMSYFDF